MTPRTDVNMTNLPLRMRSLPIDKRGYPIPWFVAWINGEPEFRAMDKDKWTRAVQEKLCWVCGQKLGTNICFVAGPMCGINRTSSEPPSHVTCGEWSGVNCPFLSNPRAIRREDEVLDNRKLTEAAPGIALSRNPGVVMLWITRTYEVFDDQRGGLLIQMGEPDRVEWIAYGRKATRAEVQESVDTGLPSLVAVAQLEKGAMEHLNRAIKRFEKWIPSE